MDLILINGKFKTMDNSKPNADAAAIMDGKTCKVGSNSEVLKLKTDSTEIIDLGGKLVIPGLNDSHMHLYSFGESLRMANLSHTRSIDDVICTVRNFIQEKEIEKNSWVRGRGWNQDYFTTDRGFPNRYDLDKISSSHPIILARTCGHVSVVNSKALELAGVTAHTPQVEGGCFDVDERGEPLGIFRENALRLIYDIMPPCDIEEVKAALKEAASYANSKGVTSVQSDDLEHVPGKDFRMMLRAYTELRDAGELTVRVNEQCLLSSQHKLEEFLREGYNTGDGDEFFRIGPLKILADGSLGARTAALCEPYADDPGNLGIAAYTQNELDGLIITAHNAGMNVAVHCIGDRIMHMAFDSIERALRENPRQGHRHSIVHCQITDEALLDKFKDMDVIALIQPIFLHYDIHMVEDRIGTERARSTYAFKTLLDKGVHIALGSDCPVEPLDTMPNIYCAVTRKDLRGYPENGWLPAERLSVEEAVFNYTMGGAYASFEEDIKGSITQGKLADMTVLSEDIFEVPEELIKDTEIYMTILGGKIVYRR